jgi:hypothetical protein
LRIAFVLSLAAVLSVVLAAGAARADPPSPELMAKLAAASAGFEQLRKRATYAIDSRIETLDDDGRVTTVETRSAHVVREGTTTHLVVVNATKDGKDWSEQARKSAREDAKDARDPKKRRPEIPFLASQQSRYIFDVVGADPNCPGHLRIAFTPKEPDVHSVEGSAWVDRNDGLFLSAGFKLSKPGMFVDYVLVTLEVGATTELGPAPSRITFEGKGGFLFVHKHIRGSAVLSDYKITPP